LTTCQTLITLKLDQSDVFDASEGANLRVFTHHLVSLG
jgi:hypothetical protein